MAMYRYGYASLVSTGLTADTWTDKVYKEACSDGKCCIKTAKSIIAKYDPSRFLLSHCTIVASVDTELADPKDPKSDYYILPEFSKLVNNNGDAWTKKMLLACYKTFIGGDNFCEHVQIPELSKGKIIDAAPREIVIGKDKNGNDLSTVYIDILVATDRKHEDLVRKIEAKEIATLSMGCTIAFSVCSCCGKRAVDETEACNHVRFQKNNMFFDKNGVQRKIAELCGHYSIPDSVKFIEASWVKQPAFTGAVLRDFVQPSEEIMAKITKAEKTPSYVPKMSDFLKVAELKDVVAQPKEDKPEDEPPADEPAGPPADEPPADTPAEEPAPEEQAPPEGMPEDQVKKWKEDLKKQVLRQVTDEVLKQLSEDESGAAEPDTLDETLIKPASLVLSKYWGAQKSWDRFIQQKVGSINKRSYDKLRYGVHIAMTNSDLTVLKNFGYNKRDFLAVLSFLDGCLKNPLPMAAKKAIASMGELDTFPGSPLWNPVAALKEIVSKIGRKLTPGEARKILAWMKLLEYYPKA